MKEKFSDEIINDIVNFFSEYEALIDLVKKSSIMSIKYMDGCYTKTISYKDILCLSHDKLLEMANLIKKRIEIEERFRKEWNEIFLTDKQK